jgi:hypothetical protein
LYQAIHQNKGDIMKIISFAIRPRAVTILALTSFLLWSASHLFAHDNSAASIQNGDHYTFSHPLNAETITFEAVNPSNLAPGRMTVTITGAVRGYRLWDGQSVIGSHLQADQQASFSFVPYYPYYPSYSAAVRVLQIAGHTADDSIFFDFGLRATGSDGSVQWFVLREIVTATENGAQITFRQLEQPDRLIAHPDLPCGTVLN